MAKEKKELNLEDVCANKDDINSMLIVYEEKLDSNYQDFLKALLSEIDIINIISAINDKKINSKQKEKIKTIKDKFYKNFLDALTSVLEHFSIDNEESENN